MEVSALQDGRKAPYVLYYHAYSICSIMVRYTLALRGSARTASDEMVVEERMIEIFRGEQLTEDFLCDINPKGQVPVLCSTEMLPEPLPDSFNITLYIAEKYPSLLPVTHKEQILRLLHELHDINNFSLAFGSRPAAAIGIQLAIEKVMEQPGLTERHQDGLRYKLQVHNDEKVHAVDPRIVGKEIEKSKVLFSKLEGLLDPAAGPWMFGLHTATALDANLVPFIVRVRELGMAKLIHDNVIKYADVAMAKPEWDRVMKGRKTMPGL